MKNPLTHAISVIIVLLVGYCFLFPTPSSLLPESVALGEVIEALETQECLHAKGQAVVYFDKVPYKPPGCEDLVEELLTVEEDGRVSARSYPEYFLSPEGYANLVYLENDTLLLHLGFDNESGIVTVLIPPIKSYLRMKAPQSLRDTLSRFTMDSFVRMMQQSENHRELGIHEKQGLAAQGFEATDFQQQLFKGFNETFVSFLLNIQQMRMATWVDPATKLPIEIEGDLDVDASALTLFEKAHLTVVVDQFDWGQTIDKDYFLPSIPADYKQINPMNTVKKAAWLGLLPVGGLGYWRWSKRRKKRQVS